MKTKLDIINAALVETGNNPRQSENDGSCEALISDLNWTGLVEAELERFHYAFARKSAHLTKEAKPDYSFPKAYCLPDDCLIVRNIFEPFNESGPYGGCCKPLRPELDHDDWEESDGVLYVNDCKMRFRFDCRPPGIFVDYTKHNVAVEDWGKNFKQGIKYRLAAVFARGINEEEGVAAGYDQMAETYFQRARQRSSRRYNGSKLYKKRGRLIRAHMGYRHV